MKHKQYIVAGGVLAVVVLAGVSILCSVGSLRNARVGTMTSAIPKNGVGSTQTHMDALKKFASSKEFQSYLEQARGFREFGIGMRGGVVPLTSDVSKLSAMEGSTFSSAMPGMVPLRYSETNVQVKGIDEPDIVKTDGQHLFVLHQNQGYPQPLALDESLVSGKMIAPAPLSDTTAIVSAYPPEKLAKLSELASGGEMLLFGDVLLVFKSYPRDVIAYDLSVTDPSHELWHLSLGNEGNELVQARQYQDKLYLVVRSWANDNTPCPVVPFLLGTTEQQIPCTSIYHPIAPSPVDSVYTVSVINPRTGKVSDSSSFVGMSGQSVVYMSPEAVYVTYPKPSDPIKYVLGFFRENPSLLPAASMKKLNRLAGYDISSEAQMVELQSILSAWQGGLNGDEQLRKRNDIHDRLLAYNKKHLRSYEFTGIAKVSLANMKLAGSAVVPGHLLNQFSLDEYDGHLRVATTVGGSGNFFLWGIGGSDMTNSANDVYVFDEALKNVGSLQNLGVGERIYSTRFIGDRGYVVTFRETDPLYVLDLSNPKKPTQSGELKIPGYSSYLHPLGNHLLLGVGKEGANVKVSLFDVSQPNNPMEVSKYTLDEYWSEALLNHHAFLADEAHQVFFLPGSQGGYVFSYADRTLSLAYTAKDNTIKRAVFIGNTFYIISDTAIYAYDASTWKKIGELSL